MDVDDCGYRVSRLSINKYKYKLNADQATSIGVPVFVFIVKSSRMFSKEGKVDKQWYLYFCRLLSSAELASIKIDSNYTKNVREKYLHSSCMKPFIHYQHLKRSHPVFIIHQWICVMLEQQGVFKHTACTVCGLPIIPYARLEYLWSNRILVTIFLRLRKEMSFIYF